MKTAIPTHDLPTRGGKPPSSVPRARSSIARLSPTSKNVAASFLRREEKSGKEQR